MDLENIIYLDPLLNLFNGLDIGSLLLTCKNLQQTILPYINSKTIYKPITLYQLFINLITNFLIKLINWKTIINFYKKLLN